MDKKTTKDASKKLNLALTDLLGLQVKYDSARSAEVLARSETTKAVNELNEKQKTVDALMEDVRNSCGGDWSHKKQKC